MRRSASSKRLRVVGTGAWRADPSISNASTATAVSGQEKPAGSMPTPPDNNFQNYGVNPFVDAYEDHLSTFSLDVDTASYSVARRYVNDGSLPPAEAVRVEEFVNYFDQGYPTPPEVAFGIYADGAPSPFEYNGTHLLRIGVQGYEVPEWQRKPVSLTFVIISTSYPSFSKSAFCFSAFASVL